MNRGLGPWVIVVLALALGSAVFFQACEKRTSTQHTGLRGEAARNRYLAAQRMLEAMATVTRPFPSGMLSRWMPWRSPICHSASRSASSR